MENSQDANRQVDIILAGHVRRMQEAQLLCRHREFHPARRPAPLDVAGVSSTRKRAPPLTVDAAIKEGTYLAVLSVLRNTNAHKASQLTGVPESTIRDLVKRIETTGSATPGKRGRKEGTGRVFTDAALEDLQDFIDQNPTSTLQDMQKYLTESHGISPHITTISNVLANLKITNKTIVRVPVDRNTPLPAQERMEWAITWRYLERAGARFIYIGEAGFNLHLTSEKGWATVGYTPEVVVPKTRRRMYPCWQHSFLAERWNLTIYNMVQSHQQTLSNGWKTASSQCAEEHSLGNQ